MDKKQFSDDTGINKDDFIKISLSPDNKLVPDLNDKLPGKSVWVPANKAMINDLLRKKDLQTHFGTPEIVATDLSFLIEMIIRKKILNSISLSNKAGYLVIGLDSIKAKLLLKQHCLIIVAKGARSLTKNAFFSSKKVSCFEELLTQRDIEKSISKNRVKYIGILSKNFKKTIQVDLNKLKGFIDTLN